MNPSESSAYAKYNGTHTVGDYEVTTNQVMTNKSNGYDAIQMQAEKATITLDGNFTKVIIVIVSTYDFTNSGNDISVYAGETKLTATLTNTETNDNVKVYTVEYTVEGTGAQTFKVAKEGKYAAYAVSIDFKVAEAAE